MDFPLSLLSSLTFSVLGLVTSQLSLKHLKRYYKRRENDHTQDLFCQMQTSKILAFHPVWHLKSFPVVLSPKTI